jgi:trigger factor
MKVDVERLEKSTVALNVEVEPETADEAISRAYRRLAARVDIPGFRRGKAPRHILERRVGRTRLLDEAFKIAFPEVYRDAVADAGIEPVDDPQVEDFEIDQGKPLRFKVKVAVKPEVKLGDYRSVARRREEVTVGPNEVDAELEALRERQALLIPDDSWEVRDGSHVIVDLRGFLGETEVPGLAATGLQLAVGSAFPIPGLGEQLRGAKAGETRDVRVTMPEEYSDRELAGKEVSLKVTVREVKRKELPELDDEFAKTQGSFADLKELREWVTNRLSDLKKRRARAEHEEAVVREVTDLSTVDIPEVMIARRARTMLEDLVTRLGRNGISLRSYLEGIGRTEESFKQQLWQAAEQKVKTELVLEAVASKEGIGATNDEVKKVVDNLASSTEKDGDRLYDDLRASGAIRGFERALTNEKTIEFLADIAHANAVGRDKEEGTS